VFHLRARSLPKLAADQLTDHASGPQRELELQLPRVRARDQRKEPAYLLTGQLRRPDAGTRFSRPPSRACAGSPCARCGSARSPPQRWFSCTTSMTAQHDHPTALTPTGKGSVHPGTTHVPLPGRRVARWRRARSRPFRRGGLLAGRGRAPLRP
jgi:hypothetical protein